MRGNELYLFSSFSGAVNSELLLIISISKQHIPGCQALLSLQVTLKGGITHTSLECFHLFQLCACCPTDHFQMQISPLLFEDSCLLLPFSLNYPSTHPTPRWVSVDCRPVAKNLKKNWKPFTFYPVSSPFLFAVVSVAENYFWSSAG